MSKSILRFRPPRRKARMRVNLAAAAISGSARPAAADAPRAPVECRRGGFPPSRAKSLEHWGERPDSNRRHPESQSKPSRRISTACGILHCLPPHQPSMGYADFVYLFWRSLRVLLRLLTTPVLPPECERELPPGPLSGRGCVVHLWLNQRKIAVAHYCLVIFRRDAVNSKRGGLFKANRCERYEALTASERTERSTTTTDALRHGCLESQAPQSLWRL